MKKTILILSAAVGLLTSGMASPVNITNDLSQTVYVANVSTNAGVKAFSAWQPVTNATHVAYTVQTTNLLAIQRGNVIRSVTAASGNVSALWTNSAAITQPLSTNTPVIPTNTYFLSTNAPGIPE